MSTTSRTGEATGGLGAALSIQNVTKRYGKMAPAVDNVSLDIQAGEFVTFLGPSGSGKTTMLSMVAGFTELTAGRIRLGVQPIDCLPPYRRNIGMVFQSYSLFPHMSVFDNVAFPLRRRGVSAEEIGKRVGRVLELIQLADKATRFPVALSGGQQQRVALARAIVFEPQLLLMDEPLSALDKKLREELQIEIRRLHQELRITFLFVTHDQEEAMVMSDRIGVFNKGRLVQVGTANELYERPLSLFVANFLGDSNIIIGETVRNGELVMLRSEIGQFAIANPKESQAVGRAAICVRPEQMRILPVSTATERDNRVVGTVSQIIDVGSSRKVEVTLGNGSRIRVREQPRDVVPVTEGLKIAVCWPSAATRLIPSDEITLG